MLTESKATGTDRPCLLEFVDALARCSFDFIDR